MDNGISSLFKVKINFAESHTFFPTIVFWVLLILLLLIFIFNGRPYLRSLRNGERKLSLSLAHVDKLRLPGTLVLTVAYFLLMDYVGTFFPNQGLGFLFVSIPFIFLLSLLYVHRIDRRKILAMSLNALIAPSVAWYVLAQLFNITLP
ncbi:MAG: tripartite tricarboxylate transporter [Desulfuromonas sp.]|nr:MAG: tripartite tricarboxylate transporter [Desulfuromonas sp.]